MSNDTFTEVTSQSWGSRLGGAFKGIIIGILLVIASLVLLFWNEGRAVKRYKTLKEGSGAVIVVSAEVVDSGNEGKLVHMTGMVTSDEILTDTSFGVSSQALKLLRIAEMYQWQQESRSEEKKKIGGGTETTTTYTYNTVWAENLINSDQFRKADGHQNPVDMAYRSVELVAAQPMVGAFTLAPGLMQKISGYKPLVLGPDYTLPDGIQGKGLLGSTGIYLGEYPDNPQIGDIRISFKELKPLTISLVAGQKNDTLQSYQTKVGGSIALLQAGEYSAEMMFQQAGQSNNILTWILRGVGFVLMLIGFHLVLAPLSVFADVLPILGSLVGVGTGIIAALFTVSLSILTVAVAWLVYRPFIAFTMLMVSGGIILLLFKKLRNK